jgi:acyl-CoA thioesterase
MQGLAVDLWRKASVYVHGDHDAKGEQDLNFGWSQDERARGEHFFCCQGALALCVVGKNEDDARHAMSDHLPYWVKRTDDARP